MQVKVRALIWCDGRLLVHEEHRQGATVVTLPGGGVRDRESLAQALCREVDEELGLAVRIGALRYVAEVVHGHTVHDVNLVFDAEPFDPLPPGRRLVDPAAPVEGVLPPILRHIADDGERGGPAPRWLGNVWQPTA